MNYITSFKQPEIDSSENIVYLDHIKILLTVLVILHHAFVTYNTDSGWYYSEPTTLLAAKIPITLLVSINQSFFMGMFFFLSAYFTGASLKRKGTASFLKDRFKRFGIPIIFYSLILSPFVSFIVYRYAKHNQVTLLEYLGGYDSWISLGVLWFVAALLLFTLIYVLIKMVKPNLIIHMKLPGNSSLLLIVIGMGIISFLVRILFPVGWSLKPLGFQFGHFTQYIVLFAAGFLARNNNWLEDLNPKTIKKAGWLALFMIVFLFPIMVYVKNVLHSPIEHFMGGCNWISLYYSIWEQVTGISIMIFLLGVGKKYWNKQSFFLSKVSRSAFATYIFHPLILVSISVAFSGWQIEPALKLCVVGPLSVIGSFLFAMLVVKIKGVNKII